MLAGSMRGWRADKLRRFQELHFTYEEEASPEDFFVPYVWTQVLLALPSPFVSLLFGAVVIHTGRRVESLTSGCLLLAPVLCSMHA